LQNQLSALSNQFQAQNTQGQSEGLRNTIFFKMVNLQFCYKLLRVCLYQSDFGSTGFSKDSDIVTMIKGFIYTSIKETKRRNPENVSKKQLLNAIHLTSQILDIKQEITSRLITYDNIFDHFQNLDQNMTAMLNKIVNDRINTAGEFHNEMNDILHTIQMFNEMMTLDGVLIQVDALRNLASDESCSVLNVVKEYKETVLSAYDSLSSLTTIMNDDALSDYLVFCDKPSISRAIEDISKFLSTSYNHYKTGYDLFDTAVDGFETSSVHIIAGPSNHAKSIFMLNIAKNLILYNRSDLKSNDAIIFITLEDDIHKLLRRIISIFGGYDSRIVKSMFHNLGQFFQKQNDIDITNKNTRSAGIGILEKVLNETILSVTNSECSFIIKHCNENSFSMRDATRFIDKLKMEGLNVKAVFIDYLDVMKSSSSNYDGYKDDYNLHGEILQEMRTCAKNYAIPVITITQNARISENVQQELSNNVIGDSYKKVRYADYIYMIRQRPDIDIISDQIKNDMSGDASKVNMSTDISKLIPFEVKITKAKDGERGAKRFHIFSRQDLRVYQSYDDLLIGMNDSKMKSSELQKELGLMGTGIDLIIDDSSMVEKSEDVINNILL